MNGSLLSISREEVPKWSEESGRVFDDRGSDEVFFGGKSNDGHHRETSVFDFGELHPASPGTFGRVKSERIEAKVSGFDKCLRFLSVAFEHGPESKKFKGGRGTEGGSPEDGMDVVESAVEGRGRETLGGEYARHSAQLCEWFVEHFGHWPSYRSEHCKPAVLDFGFAIETQKGGRACHVEWIESKVTHHAAVEPWRAGCVHERESFGSTYGRSETVSHADNEEKYVLHTEKTKNTLVLVVR